MQNFISNSHTQRHTSCVCSSPWVHKAKHNWGFQALPSAVGTAFRKLSGRPNRDGAGMLENTLDTLLKLLLTHPRLWPSSASVYTLWSRFLRASASLSSIICPTQTPPHHGGDKKRLLPPLSGTQLPNWLVPYWGAQVILCHSGRRTISPSPQCRSLKTWAVTLHFLKHPGSDGRERTQVTPHLTAWLLRAQLTHLSLDSDPSWRSHCGSGISSLPKSLRWWKETAHTPPVAGGLWEVQQQGWRPDHPCVHLSLQQQ